MADESRPTPGCLEFGEFELDPRVGELRDRGEAVHLAPQAWRILGILAGRAGDLVTREELRQELWGDATYGDFDVGLNHCINRLRHVLRDDFERPRFIRTEPRRGYRFVAPVRRISAGVAPVLAVLPFENLGRRSRDDYLAAATTELVTNELGRCRGIHVIPRRSMLHLKGSLLPLPEIARQFGLNALVEGATLCFDERLRFTAELVATDPERHLWTGTQEGVLQDLPTYCRLVSRKIADVARRTLGGEAGDAADDPDRAAVGGF